MGKKVFYDDDARTRVLGGFKMLCDAVKVSLGPKGRNVIVTRNYGPPFATHDGVTIAQMFDIEDTRDTLGYKAGVDLIRSSAIKMNKLAGDGTTTVTILTYHILKEAHKLIALGYNPMLLRKDVESASKYVLKQLNTLSEKLPANSPKVAQVATISAGDSEIGTLIAKLIKELGKDGVITVEEGQGLEMESEIVQGYTFDKGYISPYMMTDPSRGEAVYEDVPILITDERISSFEVIQPLLDSLHAQNITELFIIANDVDGTALQGLTLNTLKGNFKTVAVKAPGFGDSSKEFLNDIAILTGGTLISEDTGYSLDQVTLPMLGFAKKVIVKALDTTIIEGRGDPKVIATRIAEIHKHAEHVDSEYAAGRLESRAASLSGKVAVIKVGGATESEIEEKKFRVDDAVAAVKAALADGIVAGGGITLLKLAKSLPVIPQIKVRWYGVFIRRYLWHRKNAYSKVLGSALLHDALEMPFKILLENSGIDWQEWLKPIVDKPGFGLDVMNPDKLINLKKAGIIDPTKVTKEAIQNAVSIAGVAMTMGALIVEETKPEQPQMPSAPMVPGMRP
jgi:chaperonin GroEL